jgi:hypothetical protein
VARWFDLMVVAWWWPATSSTWLGNGGHGHNGVRARELGRKAEGAKEIEWGEMGRALGCCSSPVARRRVRGKVEDARWPCTVDA